MCHGAEGSSGASRMCRSKPLTIALDSEFVKAHGDVFASTVAFVPFSMASAVARRQTEEGGGNDAFGVTARPPSKGMRMRTQPRMTVFGSPIILNLSSVEVFRRADLFPCGHCLEPLLQEALVSGKELKAIQRHHTQGAGAHPLPAEFDSLCPHSIPNIRRVNRAWLQALHDASVHSSDFREATMQLNYLRPYGKGKRQVRSIPFLLWHSPELLQDVLRASFPTSNEWCAWLSMCADVVEAELSRLAKELRRAPSLPTALASSSAGAVAGYPCTDANGTDGAGQYKECGSIEELSCELNRVWGSLAHSGGGKFYSYGGMDARAIHNSLRFSCAGAGVGERRLASPFEAKLVDVTRHSLFAAAGFCASPRAIPTLQRALEKAAAVDRTAARLHERSDHHNPLWDAKALACISVACGIGVGAGGSV